MAIAAPEKALALTKIPFDLNIIILGTIASVYANQTYGSPNRNWGVGAKRDIFWNNDQYIASPHRKKGGEVGVMLIRIKNAYNGGRAREQWFIPCSALESVHVELPCEDVTE